MKRRANAAKNLHSSLVAAVVEFVASAGMHEEDLRAAFEDALRKYPRSKMVRTMSEGYLQLGDLSADILRTWHRDHRYIDDKNANPKPLFPTKGRASIASIALKLNPKANVDGLVAYMIRSGLLRAVAGGRYLPSTEAGAISCTREFVSEHIARSVMRLMRTVRRNTDAVGEQQQLIERFAYVTDLDPKEAKNFSDFTRRQGHGYLQSVDDWMEHRRIEVDKKGAGRSRRGVVAGVQIIAYLGDGVSAQRHEIESRRVQRGSEGTDRVSLGIKPKRRATRLLSAPA